MKKHLTLALCCAFTNAALLHSNNEAPISAAQAELTFRSVIAKVILDHQEKFTKLNPDLVTKAKVYATQTGYVELLIASNKLKTNKELMASLNEQLKKSMNIMESAIHPEEKIRQSLFKMMETFNDEMQAKNHLDKAFGATDFSQEDVTTIDQALTPEVTTQA